MFRPSKAPRFAAPLLCKSPSESCSQQPPDISGDLSFRCLKSGPTASAFLSPVSQVQNATPEKQNTTTSQRSGGTQNSTKNSYRNWILVLFSVSQGIAAKSRSPLENIDHKPQMEHQKRNGHPCFSVVILSWRAGPRRCWLSTKSKMDTPLSQG